MSHLLSLEDIKEGQIVHVALGRDEGLFLNQNFPATPKGRFLLGGIFQGKKDEMITIELKAFRNLSTVDIDYVMKGNICNIPTKNIEKILLFSGTTWIFLCS